MQTNDHQNLQISMGNLEVALFLTLVCLLIVLKKQPSRHAHKLSDFHWSSAEASKIIKSEFPYQLLVTFFSLPRRKKNKKNRKWIYSKEVIT